MPPLLKPAAALALAALTASSSPAQRPADRPPRTEPLRAGMVITSSVRIAPGRYSLPAPASLDSAVIIVRGTDITVRGISRLPGPH